MTIRSPLSLAWRVAVLAATLLTFVCPGAAREELRGVALVVGNSDYEHLSPLANPDGDARAVEELLGALGFDTTLVSNRDARRLARDLEGFVEDAEDADVVVLYYAGHGIEAGGENFLIPVDADISALNRASEKLVPLSRIIADLQATVDVTIVLLDACRNNPFPSGATLRLTSGAVAPIAAGGLLLGRARGASRLGPDSSDGSLGVVIGFAAEPGKVALDGAPGERSPYAAALTKHFSAMAGAEFGQVMRMVGEEVYLKTAGRQRPWVNENLRRLLYFGEAPAAPEGDVGDVLAERRGLLLTIAGLSEVRRGQVERVAREGGVPFDAVYGMLRALGSNVPEDATKLDELLRSEAVRFARILAERETIASPDPEIVRLSALADVAEREGALNKAGELRERAKERFLQLESTLEKQETALRQRFVEGAAVFARSGATKALAFDHLGAARDYEEAFSRVDGREPLSAWRYKQEHIVALTDHGRFSGDNAALVQALDAAREARRAAEVLGSREARAKTEVAMADALQILGKRDTGTARLEEAAAAYRAALGGLDRHSSPQDWSAAQNNLGAVLWHLGQREAGTVRLQEAAVVLRAALQERGREVTPFRWASTQNNLANVLATIGERRHDRAALEQAVAAYRAALEVWTREQAPLDWATVQNNLGATLAALSSYGGGTARLKQAETAYRLALEERRREQVPLDWATTQFNLGTVLLSIGQREDGTAKLAEAADAFRAALQERTRDRVPGEWADTQHNLGAALWWLGERVEGTAELKDSIAAYRAALVVRTRERAPLAWAATQNALGLSLFRLGDRNGDSALLQEAVQALRRALEERTQERAAGDRLDTQQNLGTMLRRLAQLTGDASSLEEAATTYGDAASPSLRALAPHRWATMQNQFANTLKMLGDRQQSTATLERALAAYRELLSVRTRKTAAFEWALTQHDMGLTLMAIGLLESGSAKLEEAEVCFRLALEELDPQQTARQWAQANLNLAALLLEIGKRTGNRAELDAGRQLIVAVWEVYRKAGQTQHDEFFRGRLAEAERLMNVVK